MTDEHEHEHIPLAEGLADIDPRPDFRLPGEIAVLGQTYTVEIQEHETRALSEDHPESANSIGLTDRNRNRIIVRGASALCEDKAREVLLHEVMHATIGVARMDPLWSGTTEDGHDLEEAVVKSLAPLLLAVLRDNPLLVAALISK